MTTYLKAVVAFLVAVTGSLATAAVDNSIVLGEWMAALATAVAAGGAVFATPNKTQREPGIDLIRPPHVPSPGNPPIH